MSKFNTNLNIEDFVYATMIIGLSEIKPPYDDEMLKLFGQYHALSEEDKNSYLEVAAGQYGKIKEAMNHLIKNAEEETTNVS